MKIIVYQKKISKGCILKKLNTTGLIRADGIT